MAGININLADYKARIAWLAWYSTDNDEDAYYVYTDIMTALKDNQIG